MDPRNERVLRRAHSFTGVVPLAVFLVLHVGVNATALVGPFAFGAVVRRIQAIPLLGVVEIAFLLAPLGVHAGIGVWIALASSYPAFRTNARGDWADSLQRLTGLGTLAFAAIHLAQFRIAQAAGRIGAANFYDRLGSVLGEPGWLAAYLVGISCAIFHVANGVPRFCATWGFVRTEPARRRAAIASGGAGAVLWALAMVVAARFAIGSA